ncbi:N-acetylglucosamine-6-phosphate deacetylase [Oscillatoriales cyanobacterium USR001]|nr:N-acetylglucosamine-6-phosphate deacetylase [Oscillatoriales cyanobacterium USR001]
MIAPITPTATPFNILNAKMLGQKGLQAIAIDKFGMIEAVYPMEEFKEISQSEIPAIDLVGDLLSLGGVDLQINGALGLAFTDLENKDIPFLQKICQFLWLQGIDAFLPTLVTTSLEKFRRSLATIADFMVRQKSTSGNSAQILGVHLEGPFLNYQKRGAHPSEFLLPLTIENIKQVLGDYANIVKIITIAPELDRIGKTIPYLRNLGITVSLGHSMATATEAEKAFQQGASMVTHAFNAMPSLHHREPGLLGTAIVNRNIKCGLIADGQHVTPTMIDILLRSSQYEQGIFLVSDALAPLGLRDGVYPWDSRQIEVKKGTAWVHVSYHEAVESGTLAGTTLPLLMGVKNLVKWGICDEEIAIKLAVESPRKAMGFYEICGQLGIQLLRWKLDEVTQDLTWERLLS